MTARLTGAFSRHGYILACGDRPFHGALPARPGRLRQGPVGAALPARHPARGERRRRRPGRPRRRARLLRLELLLPAAVPHARGPRLEGLAVARGVPGRRRHRRASRPDGCANARRARWRASARRRRSTGSARRSSRRRPPSRWRRAASARWSTVLDASSATLFVPSGTTPRRLLPGAVRRRRDPSRRGERAGATFAPRRRRDAGGARRRTTAGCTCRCTARPESSACSPCRRARTGGPYSAGDARLVTSLANLVGAFLERERLQARPPRAAAEREADRLKSSLLSSVSHELKTPLAALTATVSNLLESDVDWDEESVRDELRAIVADVARLNNSIGALLELSRLEAHAWEPRRELYELSDIVAAGIDTLPAAPARARRAGPARGLARRRRRLRAVDARHPEPARERAPLRRRRHGDGRRPRLERGRAPLGRGPRTRRPGRRTRGGVREVLPRPAPAASTCAVRHRPRPRDRARDRAQPRRARSASRT